MANNKIVSNKQEKLVASEVNGKQVSGSGARPFAPGDVESDTWLIECKTRNDAGHRIVFKKDTWKKIVEEASVRHRYPAYVCDDGSQRLCEQWIIFHSCPEDIVSAAELNSVFQNDKSISFYSSDLDSSNVYSFFFDNNKMYLTSLLNFTEIVR